MASISRHTISLRLPALLVLVAFVIVTGSNAVPSAADAAHLQQRELKLSNNLPNATGVDYAFSFGLATSGTVGSIRLQLCENDPFIDTACTPPPGLSVTSATLSSQAGQTGFSISNLSTANVEILTRAPQAAIAGNVSYTLSGITNPSTAETLYARLQTYDGTDATGSNVDEGALAWEIEDGLKVSTQVPPYLEFCTGTTISNFDCSTAAGDYLNFGELSSAVTRAASSQMMTATNAPNGYTIRLTGNTLTSNNNIIAPMTNGNAQAGVSQFGINLRQNNNPAIGQDPDGSNAAVPSPDYNTANNYRFGSGEVIAGAAGGTDYTKLTASYIVNIPRSQPAGDYISTITYICLANF
jgi:hypothetical protein